MPRRPASRPFRPLADEAALGEVVRVAGALANPTRVCLLAELGKGEASVGELVDRLRLPQSTVSNHLVVLRQHRLVTRRQEGRAIFYALVAGTEQRVAIRLGSTWLYLSVRRPTGPGA